MVEETLSLVQINSNNLKLLCLFDYYLLDLKYPFEFLLLSLLTKSTEFKIIIIQQNVYSWKKKELYGYVILCSISRLWFFKPSRYFFNFIDSLILGTHA